MSAENTGTGKNLLAWYFGLDPKLEVYVQKCLPQCKIEKIPCDLEKLLSDEWEEIPSIIFCGLPPAGIQLTEVAQTLRSCFTETPIFLTIDSTHVADRAKMLKNGFNDVFFLPLDEQVLQSQISKLYSSLSGAQKRYRSVKLMDMQGDTKLDFDTFIYLPMNNKYVRISASKEVLGANQLKKLKTHKMNSLFVSEEDMPKFYDYAAAALKAIGDNSGMSETEKQDRMKDSIRNLMSGFFSDEAAGLESGKKVAEDCRKIVQSYMSSSKVNDVYSKILSVSNAEGDSYSHSMNVSAYASLFGMVLGLKNVEELALAGLLHDIGKTKVPVEILQKDPAQWTKEEREVYQNHPDVSVAMIKEKKIIVSETVFKMIAQHHERTDGSGYPKGPNCGKIILESQILALANEFDHMMTVVPGRARMTPPEVIRHFHKMAVGDPTKAILDIQNLKKILAVFPLDEGAAQNPTVA